MSPRVQQILKQKQRDDRGWLVEDRQGKCTVKSVYAIYNPTSLLLKCILPTSCYNICLVLSEVFLWPPEPDLPLHTIPQDKAIGINSQMKEPQSLQTSVG
jgi:hypothetical protein